MSKAFPSTRPISIQRGRRNEPPARSLARLALQVEKRVGVTISIGLAPNKMLAKIASDFGKPRGFYVIGESDKLVVLAPMKVSPCPASAR